jgi:hypothetical protein
MGSSLFFAILLTLAPVKTEELPPPVPKRSSSWKAKVFVAGACLAVVAGVAIICFDKGTANSAIDANNETREAKAAACCEAEPRTCCPLERTRCERSF